MPSELVSIALGEREIGREKGKIEGSLKERELNLCHYQADMTHVHLNEVQQALQSVLWPREGLIGTLLKTALWQV